MFQDPIFWLLVAPGLLLGLYAQGRIKANYIRYSQVATSGGIVGAQVARQLLDSQGLQSVAIDSSPRMLSDHYDPNSKMLTLSNGVYYAPTLAAAGIAAHEAGHALQDAAGYPLIKLRSYIVPLVQLSSQFAPWVFIIGIVFGSSPIAWTGVVLYGAQTVFALVTLPVELDASARAEALLLSQGIIRGDEQVAGVEKVLGAAAWTYVASAVSAVGSLFYLLLIGYAASRRAP